METNREALDKLINEQDPLAVFQQVILNFVIYEAHVIVKSEEHTSRFYFEAHVHMDAFSEWFKKNIFSSTMEMRDIVRLTESEIKVTKFELLRD